MRAENKSGGKFRNCNDKKGLIEPEPKESLALETFSASSAYHRQKIETSCDKHATRISVTRVYQ